MLLRLLITLLLLPSPLLAWSHKEHSQFARLAALVLIEDPDTPAVLKEWLRANTPDLKDWEAERQFLLTARVGPNPQGLEGLAFWACRPDMDRNGIGKETLIPPWNVSEGKLHYVDLEIFTNGLYADDLSSLPEPHAIPRDAADPRWQRAGMLPFRLEQSYAHLVRCFREGDLHPADAFDQDFAARWAGYAAHYAQDNTQPHHATVDYKSASYFPGHPKPPNIHNEMEWRMLDGEDDDFADLRADYWQLLERKVRGRPIPPHEDVWSTSIDTAFAAYRHLPLIGRAAVAAFNPQADTFDTRTFFEHRGNQGPGVLEMKSDQAAAAILRTASLWRAAWIEAHGR